MRERQSNLIVTITFEVDSNQEWFASHYAIICTMAYYRNQSNNVGRI